MTQEKNATLLQFKETKELVLANYVRGMEKNKKKKEEPKDDALHRFSE